MMLILIVSCVVLNYEFFAAVEGTELAIIYIDNCRTPRGQTKTTDMARTLKSVV